MVHLLWDISSIPIVVAVFFRTVLETSDEKATDYETTTLISTKTQENVERIILEAFLVENKVAADYYYW